MIKFNGSVPAVPMGPRATAAFGAALARAVARGVEVMLEWHDRSVQRHHLMSLDDRALKDLGISRADAEGESRKPFWMY